MPDANKGKPRSDRRWWPRLCRMGYARRERFIALAHKWGIISDYALWEVLSHHGGPMPCSNAATVYKRLGFVPFAGYPLTLKWAITGGIKDV